MATRPRAKNLHLGDRSLHEPAWLRAPVMAYRLLRCGLMRVLAMAVVLVVGCHTRGPDGATPDASGGIPDASIPVVDAPPPVAPDDPGTADVRITIDSARDAHPISPFIYGTNAPDWARDAAL